jgi:hypothetical protein
MGATDCERIGTGWLAQPANAVSSLAYVAVGGWLLRRAVEQGAERGLFVTTGTALAAVGLGSAGFHGPQPSWAGPAHDAAIAGLVVALGGHAVWRLARKRGRRAAAAAARTWGVAAACGAVGVAAYVTGRTGGLLCRPESLWQPHAVWHVISALGLGAAVLALAETSAKSKSPNLGSITRTF